MVFQYLFVLCSHTDCQHDHWNFFPVHVFGTTELKQLYALSAVLMDADSGRILFSKNGQEERAMASTTKIMTCILALESGMIDSENQIVTVSDQAAAQPKVCLGMVAGERFLFKRSSLFLNAGVA